MILKTKPDRFTLAVIVSMTLMYLYNVCVNGMKAISGISAQQIIAVGGMSKDTSYLRLFTSLFAHQSITHYLANVIMVFLLGYMVYEAFGTVRYMVGFLLSGLIGNIFMLTIINNGTSLGISGCVFGLMGMLLVGSVSKVERFKYLNDIKNFVITMVSVCLLYTLFSVDRGVNIYTHLIGFIVGVLFALCSVIIMKIKRV